MCNPNFRNITDGTKIKPIRSNSTAALWFIIGVIFAGSFAVVVYNLMRGLDAWYQVLPAVFIATGTAFGLIYLARWMRNHNLYSAFRITDEYFQYWDWRNQPVVINYNEMQKLSVIQFAPSFMRINYHRNDIKHILKIWFIDSWDEEILNKVIRIICERANLSKTDPLYWWEFISGNIVRYEKRET